MQKNDLPANIFGKTNRIRGGIADALLFRAAGLSILLAIPLATAYSVLLESFGASTMRIRALFFVAIALVLAQASFGGTVSSCANWATSPYTGGAGGLYTQFTCSLYNTASSYTIDLTSVETEGGALLSNNAVGAGYFVVINGNPSTMPDNSGAGGLLNQSLWQTVLYFQGDQCGGACSDSLTVDWLGAFPSASTILTFDDNLYPGNPDSAFFIAATPPETVFAADANHNYDVYTPEPGTIVLLGSSLALLSGIVLKRRRTADRAA